MEKNENNKANNKNEYYVIDILHILRALLKKAWVILLVSIITGVASLLFTVFFVDPKYASSIMLYVNNQNQSDKQNQNISSSDLTASIKLVDSYIVILESRTTIEDVIAVTGVPHTYKEVKDMISAEAVNSTEIFRVTVTSTDPEEAKVIADGIAKVLPDRIAGIMEGTSMRLVDGTTQNASKVSPNITTNTIIGVLVGFLITCAIIAVFAVLDDTIRSEDQIIQLYDVPILAKIPDLDFDNSRSRRSSYYAGYYSEEEQKSNNEESEVNGNEKK